MAANPRHGVVCFKLVSQGSPPSDGGGAPSAHSSPRLSPGHASLPSWLTEALLFPETGHKNLPEGTTDKHLTLGFRYGGLKTHLAAREVSGQLKVGVLQGGHPHMVFPNVPGPCP